MQEKSLTADYADEIPQITTDLKRICSLIKSETKQKMTNCKSLFKTFCII